MFVGASTQATTFHTWSSSPGENGFDTAILNTGRGGDGYGGGGGGDGGGGPAGNGGNAGQDGAPGRGVRGGYGAFWISLPTDALVTFSGGTGGLAGVHDMPTVNSSGGRGYGAGGGGADDNSGCGCGGGGGGVLVNGAGPTAGGSVGTTPGDGAPGFIYVEY